MLVPVLDQNNNPLMPCSPARARKLLKKGSATSYYQKSFFCIRLTREPSSKNYQTVALGIDPGSKREGYTVATKKHVVLNITSNTPDWIKDHVEARRILRRNRRSRKTPYRKCRENRSSLRNSNRVPPSTKARWQAKLNTIKFLKSILPISIINVEDIKATSKEGKKKWNVSFSPLEVGKTWFYNRVEKITTLIKTEGYTTKEHRDKRPFSKSKAKLDYTWEAHNVDSHSLAEMVLSSKIEPDRSMYRIDYLQFYRRQLHKQNYTKGHIRKEYGTTVSLGLSRGSVVRYRNKLYFLGGSSKGKLSLHDIKSGKRITQNAKLGDVKMLYTSKQRVQFLPRPKSWVSLHNFS